ncbi:MAG: MarR family winged helix-turn-helix transcriptional regulator [Proteobacteria bacterium]|nr:MarR family winged helix-turn-helix transcriptional regulator [Pseudomonadota bacterium]
MDEFIIQLFRKNLRLLEKKLAMQLKEDSFCCGVTIAQCHTLLAVEAKRITTVTELAGELELDKSTLSRTIDGLVTTGLINRETITGNRRSQHISLTPQGKKVTAGINMQWNLYFASLFARIPESKHQTVIESIAILSDIIPSSGCCCETGECEDAQQEIWGSDKNNEREQK